MCSLVWQSLLRLLAQRLSSLRKTKLGGSKHESLQEGVGPDPSTRCLLLEPSGNLLLVEVKKGWAHTGNRVQADLGK